MAKNNLAKRIVQNQRDTGVLTQKWTSQAFIDATVMVLCDHGMTGAEAIEIAKEIHTLSFEVRNGLTGNVDADATRVQVDRKLSELLPPEEMLPWPERYCDWREDSVEEERKRRRYRGK